MLDFDEMLKEVGFTFKDFLIFMIDGGQAEKTAEQLQLDEFDEYNQEDFDKYLIEKIKGI